MKGTYKMKIKNTIIFLFIILMTLKISSCKESEGETKTSGIPEPVVGLNIEEYKIVRGVNANTDVIGYVANFKKAIDVVTGGNISINDDWLGAGKVSDDSAKEILVGVTNRSQSGQVLSHITGTGYNIEVIGNKIVIIGTNDIMLLQAINYFTENYINPSVEKVILPEHLSYKSDSAPILELLKDGKINCVIIYASQDNEYNLGYAKQIQTEFKSLTGKEISIQSDTETLSGDIKYSIDKYEYTILIGDTALLQTQTVKNGIKINEYAVEVCDGALVICGWTRTTMESSVKAFIKTLKIFSSENVDNSASFGIWSCLSIKMSYNRWFVDIPEYTNGVLKGAYDCNNDTLQWYYTETDVTQYNKYLSLLESKGYSSYCSNKIGNNLYATYTNNSDFAITVNYIDYLKAVRIISEPVEFLPPLRDDNYKKITKTNLTQMKLDESSGMSYIVTLEDGSFIVIDGGKSSDANLLTIYNLLNSLNKRNDGKIVIAAWIVTHSHSDHYGTFAKFADTYGRKVILEQVVLNVPAWSSSLISTNKDNFINEKLSGILNGFGTPDVYKPHAGQKFYIRNAEIEVMYTHEDVFPNILAEFNDTSMVFSMTLSEQKILFLADIYAAGSTLICNMYGNYLKSDFVQVAHHGYNNGGTLLLYKTVAAEVALLPCSLKQDTTSTVIVRGWLKLIGTKQVIVSYENNVTLEIPYTIR